MRCHSDLVLRTTRAPAGRRGEKRQGSILIIALGVLTLLSILGVAFASIMRLERRATENYIDGKRMDLLLDSALDRVIASLQGAKNYRSFTYYKDTPWLNVLGATRRRQTGEQDLAHGRAPIEDERVGRWELFSQREGHRALYKSKVIDCSAQINLNGQQDSLARMLDNLGKAIAQSQRLGREGKKVFNPLYTGPKQSGDIVTGANIIQFRRLLPGGRFTSKSQLKYVIGPENYELIRDFITCHSWEDPFTYKPTDGDDEVPVRGLGGGGGGARALGGANAVTVLESASGTPRIDAEPRHPININTAPEEVLIACLWGLAGRRIFPYSKIGAGGGSMVPIDQNAQILGDRVIGEEEYRDVAPRAVFVYSPPLEYDHAKNIADAIIRQRKLQPFMAWRTNHSQYLGFEDFVDTKIEESDLPVAQNCIIVDPKQVNNRQIEQHIRGSGAATPNGRLWTQGHGTGPERQLRRQKNMAYHRQNAFYFDLIKGVIKANFNPNSRLNRYNPNSASWVPVDKSDLVHAEVDRRTFRKGHSTEFCFDTMGVYEITTLGSIDELKGVARVKGRTSLSSIAPEPFSRPFQRKTRTVVKVFDVLRHTNQYHFERTFSSQGRSSAADRKYVVTWPEPMAALTELYTAGSLRDGRVELAGLLDGERLQAPFQSRNQLYQKGASVIAAVGFQDRDPASLGRLKSALRGAKNLVNDAISTELRRVLDVNFNREDPLARELVSRQKVIELGGVIDDAALHRDAKVDREVLGTDLLPDGLHSSLLRTSHLESRLLYLPARQALGKPSQSGGSNITVGESGQGSKGRNVIGNVPYYKGGLAFWVKFDFDGSDPVFSGLLGCTQVIEAVSPNKADYSGSEGTQFFIFKNTEGWLRVVRMYYHQAFYLSGGEGGDGGGGGDTGGGGEGGTGVTLYPDAEGEEGGVQRNPILDFIDQEKIVSRSDLIVNVRHFRAHEWHHIALDWDDQNPGRCLRLYIDFEEVREGGAPRLAQAEVGEANSWVRLNERQPRDGLTIGGIIRNQGVDDAGVFKWWTTSASAGGGSSAVRTLSPSVKRILANATIDELVTYEGQFGGAKQYYGATGSPGYFTNQTGEYVNMFEIPVPPDMDSVVLRSLDWTSYYPVMYTDSQPNSPPTEVRIQPMSCQPIFFSTSSSAPAPFVEPWRQPTIVNPIAGRRAVKRRGAALEGQNVEFVYRFLMNGGQSQQGNTVGGIVQTPAIDDVTLTYFLPSPKILVQEEIE